MYESNIVINMTSQMPLLYEDEGSSKVEFVSESFCNSNIMLGLNIA